MNELPPPRFANALLRLCCPRERVEDIEGDLHELFLQRIAAAGPARAQREYRFAVFDICMRQLASRASRALVRPVRIGSRARIYPLRVLACIAVIAALLTPFDEAGFEFVRTTLLVAFTFPELLLVARRFRRKRRNRVSDT